MTAEGISASVQICSSLQAAEHPSKFWVLASSHSSPRSGIPLPQTASVVSLQAVLHLRGSPLSVPSSQNSVPPLSFQIYASPHVAALQLPLPSTSGHASLLFWLASSQSSSASATPLPQIASVMSLQTVLHLRGVPFCDPSSHVSVPPSVFHRNASPHSASWQIPPTPSGQLSLLFWLPSSQFSPCSITPFPHSGGVMPVQVGLH